MKKGLMSTVGLLVASFAFFVFGAEIYVSPTGSDNADGSQATPLATITAARDKADQLKATNPPVTVFLRGGTYYLGAPVVFGPTNSGTATAPIIYASFPGEKAVISGGIKVTSAWAASSKANIMVTTIATGLKVDQLFLNGTRQVLARFPNFNANTVILNGYDANCIAASRVGTWAAPGEGPGYFRGIDGNSWGGASYIITGKNGTTLTTKWVGDNNRVSTVSANYRMVENIYEELDAPGEWFYRPSTGQLFFYPPAGTNLSTSLIELASQDELLRFVGTSAGSATSVKYIKFNNMVLTHTFRTLFSKTYEPVFASDWCIARAGTVFMQNAENITIQNCLFDQIGGNGVFVSGYNRSHVIYNNVFNGAGASCVVLMGLRTSVRCPNSQSGTPTCTDRTPGPVDPVNGEFPAYVRVDNNMMANLGRFEKQPAGIALSATQCDTLRHNTIHDCPRAGICFCDCSWGGTVVEYNWVYNCIQETGDHGPLNSWGRDRNWRWPTDVTARNLDAWKTTTIRNNRFEAPNGDFGIDMDDGASNYLQYNNLLFGGGLKLQWNGLNTYLNNILANAATVQFHELWLSTGHYGARNICVGNATYGIWNISNPQQVKSRIAQWDSNDVYNSGNAPVIANWGGTSQVGGFSWASNWQAAGLDVHSITSDPQFTDVNKTSWPNPAYMPKGDYTVRSSAALALGFKNFPMDSFGVMQVPTGALQYQPVDLSGQRDNARFTVYYSSGRLLVSHDGDYHVTITTALGRTVKVFNGKGSSAIAFDKKKLAKGVYYAAIRSMDGMVSRKFFVE